MTGTTTHHCPLCQSSACDPYAKDRRRHYFHCRQCRLVFAEPTSWPELATEKAEYDLHDNNLTDDGYNRFLARMVEPLTERLPEQAAILDFGCGPAPALAEQLKTLGYSVCLYDLFYYPDDTVLKKHFNAVVLTEVIEHLHTPMSELQRLWACLESHGVLAIMTQRVISQERFQHWQYKNDPTHICFYSDATFQWLAKTLSARQLEFVGRDMVFLTK